MAIGVTSPVAGLASTTGASNYALSAFTPAANSLLVLSVVATSATATPGVVTGGSLTWLSAATAVTISGNTFYLFYAQVGASPVSTTINFNCSPDSASGCAMSVCQFTGYDSSSPIRQTKMPVGITTSTNANGTFTSALLVSNGYMIGWTGGLTANSSTPPASWTEADDIAYATPSRNLATAFRAGNEPGSTYTFTNASTNWVWFGIEINSLAYSDSVTETSTIIDSPSTTKDLTDSVTEASSIVDTASATKTLTDSVAESSSIVDTPDGATTKIASVTESASLIDTQNQTTDINVSVSESSSLIDTSSTLLTLQASIIEALSAIDTQDTLLVLIASTTESASLIDQVTNALIVEGLIFEVDSLLDISSTSLIANSSVVENSALTDTSSVAKVLIASIDEVSALIDAIQASAIYNSQVIEVTNATDLVNFIASATLKYWSGSAWATVSTIVIRV